MPLIFAKTVAPGASLGLWQIAEDEPFFREKMPLAPDEEADLAPLKGIRRLEWLACRWLLHLLTGHDLRLPLAKDAFSKPFFPENERLACSLSHSKGAVAALLVDAEMPSAAHRPPSAVGCDLQKIVPQMAAIAPKFMRPEEWAFVESRPEAEHADWLHFFWTAKECLYKAWGRKSLDFRTHIRVADAIGWLDGLPGLSESKQIFFNPTVSAASTKSVQPSHAVAARGFVEKAAARLAFRVFSEKINVPGAGEFVLTWCL